MNNSNIKHDNKTINRVTSILYQNGINYTKLPYDRIIIVELYAPSDFKIMQRLLPKSGNSAIGKVLNHKAPNIPKYRPDRIIGAYRITLQCK